MESIDVTNVGIAQTVEQVKQALPAAMALAAERQAAAGAFIRDHGHEVVSGNAPVTQGQDQRGRDA